MKNCTELIEIYIALNGNKKYTVVRSAADPKARHGVIAANILYQPEQIRK